MAGAVLAESQSHGRRSTVVIEDRVVIPAWVDDLESFRRWTRSDEFPEHGWFNYLNDEIWVDLSMEQLFSHNQVKAAIALTLLALVRELALGRYILDRMRLVNPATNLSCEPDGLLVSWDRIRAGHVRFVESQDEGCVEIEGSPDMVLEVVSTSSERKDNTTLRDLYWRTGIPEYWLVDARNEPLQFAILRHTAEGYQPATATPDGWVPSTLLEREFRLTQEPDPLGHPQHTLHVRGISA